MLMGAHIARLVRSPFPALAIFVLSLASLAAVSLALTERQVLIEFKNSLDNPLALSNWVLSTRPCNGSRPNWIGVICVNGVIWGLQLENMGLAGLVDIEALVELPTLRTISLMNNNFEGTMPNIRKLGYLKALFLSNNRFSGEIPDDAFLGMGSLKKVFLANNAFSGKIPSSLTKLQKLLILKLEGNQFSGKIPMFKQPQLKVVNLANNELEGPIPPSFSTLGPSAFAGNKNLCGPPLSPCPPPPNLPEEEPLKGNPKPWALKIALVIIIVGVIMGLIAVACFVCCAGEKESKESASQDDRSHPMLTASPHEREAKKQPERAIGASRKLHNSDSGKLTFLREDIEQFDLQDMLRASAEVLGSGSFGASYKAVIANGLALVVKRYKQMNNVGREDFHEHMRRMGRLKHPNLLPLVAYYYRREEKLLVSQFVVNRSLASHLHANHTINRPGLEWSIRLKIIKGVVRGLSYLYNELPSLIVPHGHLKSSNVLLDEAFEPVLADYALRPVINQEHAHTLMIAYKSPEYAQLGRITKKTDVWCLGILILELLTGKFPENYLTSGYDSKSSLASWVNSMVKEKRTGEVFDAEMDSTKDSKTQMFSLLKIGLSCCDEDVEARPDLAEAAVQIDGLKEEDAGDDDIATTVAELNAFGSRGRDRD